MEKIVLNDGETVGLMVAPKNIVEFEKKNSGMNIVATLANGGGAPDFESLITIIYIGYLGGGNKKKMKFEDFIELLPMNLDELMKTYVKLVNSQKNSSSKKA